MSAATGSRPSVVHDVRREPVYTVRSHYPAHVSADATESKDLVAATAAEDAAFAAALPALRRYILKASRTRTITRQMLLPPSGQTAGEFAFWFIRESRRERRRRNASGGRSSTASHASDSDHDSPDT